MATNMRFGSDGSEKAITPRDPTEGYSLEEVQGYVGGLVEVVPIPGDRRNIMLVNEEGLLMGQPTNWAASVLAMRRIVGDVVVIPSESFK